MGAILRWAPPFLTLGCLLLLYIILADGKLGEIGLLLDSIANWTSLQSFKILLISLVLEAFPFIMLGVFFSALLQVFISDAAIQRFTPRNPFIGILFGSLLGLLFPLCECGMIPVVRRLIRKGMPAYIGIVYILAGPILNPIVYISTFTAFRNQPAIAYSRMGLAFGLAVTIGLLLYRFLKSNPLRDKAEPAQANSDSIPHSHGHRHKHEHGHRHLHEHAHHHRPAARTSRFQSTLSHATDEFFEMGKYLIFGAVLTAAIQTGLSREVLVSLGDHAILSNLFMMGFAFLLSICSTSDAFIAASFTGVFSAGPLLAFLVFGPMIDLKNTLMLLAVFRTKVVLALIALCAILTFAGSLLAQLIWF